ncbi:hypothetical protein MC7420_7748 [Coleofasciculus chthonoplastes PCC 7420]|uniref:Uncharacterized protein n=1 Tax=Coleofasciculus chthonoplastes PCC 7420 TaxID=118168 RepID=B4VJK2_9CYAN|nr:hypothetical protein MC7420_7748 [Coleofasciculus chthonoplastes PCC 7420]
MKRAASRNYTVTNMLLISSRIKVNGTLINFCKSTRSLN